MNWANRMLSQSSASSLLCWSCAHWLKRVASVLSDVTLSVATLRAESWTLIRVLRSARLWHVSLTWLLSPPLARATNDRPAVMFQPSDSYTCSTIPLEHRLYLMYTAVPSTRLDQLWQFLAISVWLHTILAWPPSPSKFWKQSITTGSAHLPNGAAIHWPAKGKGAKPGVRACAACIRS